MASETVSSRRRREWEARHPPEPDPRQGLLGFEPAARPKPKVLDGRVPLEAREKLEGDNALVLEALRQGPKTNSELGLLLGPGAAWRTRVSNVRRWLEARGETVARTRLGARLWSYAIEKRTQTVVGAPRQAAEEGR